MDRHNILYSGNELPLWLGVEFRLELLAWASAKRSDIEKKEHPPLYLVARTLTHSEATLSSTPFLKQDPPFIPEWGMAWNISLSSLRAPPYSPSMVLLKWRLNLSLSKPLSLEPRRGPPSPFEAWTPGWRRHPWERRRRLAVLELVASALLDVAFGFLTLAASAARLAALIPAAKGALAARAVHSVSSVSSALVAQGV